MRPSPRTKKSEPKSSPQNGEHEWEWNNYDAFDYGKSRRYRHIQKITGKDEVRLHLAELGFVVGSQVTVVNEIAGNLIVQVKESRLALDKTMANRIMVG